MVETNEHQISVQVVCIYKVYTAWLKEKAKKRAVIIAGIYWVSGIFFSFVLGYIVSRQD